MPDKARRIDYFYVMVDDKPGQVSQTLEKLKAAKVDFLAMCAFPVDGGKSQLDLVPKDPEKLQKAAAAAGIALSPRRQAFLVQGSDRPGACAQTLKKLADAGINVHAVQGIAGGTRRYGMILWPKKDQFEAAARALGI